MAYIKPSDPRYKKMTPAQRNANTLLNVKNSFKSAPKAAAKPTAKKSPSKDPQKEYERLAASNLTRSIKDQLNPTNATPKKPQAGKSTSKTVEALTSGFSRNMRALGTPIRTTTPAKPAPAKKPTTATTTKPSTPTKPAPAAKTVSQIWKEKTGKDWSEAKKLGLSDGSASSNMALLKKLNAGKITDAVLNPTKPKEEIKTATVPTREEAIKAGESLVRMRRGGVKKPTLKKKAMPVMKRGGKKK